MASLTKKILDEIRLHYEYGEDLKNLAARYKVSLSTLEKRKAAIEKKSGSWVKGCRAEVGHKFVSQEHEKARQEALSVVMANAKIKVGHITNIFNYKAKKEQELMLGKVKDSLGGIKELNLFMAPEIAFSTKVNSTRALIDLERQVISGYMTTEELQLLKFRHKQEQDKLANEREDQKLELDSEIKKADLIIKSEAALIKKKKAGEGDEEYEDSGIDDALGGEDPDSIIEDSGDFIED